MTGQQYLFVYGTLRRGFNRPMANRLARHARYIGPARIAGRLYDVGAYPAFSPSCRDGDMPVIGDLYLLSRPRQLLRKLDWFEGIGAGQSRPYEYRRECLSVTLEGGGRQSAWVYVYARFLSGCRLIPGGDYLKGGGRRRYAS